MNRFLVWTILVYLIGCFSVVSASEREQNVSVPGEIDLIGVWKFKDTDFHILVANRMKDIFIADGMDSVTAETVSKITSNVTQDLFKSQLEKMEMRLFGDNTWLNKFGEKGTWRIDGNNFFLIYEDGFVRKSEFSLDGDTLTLVIPVAQIMEETEAMRLNYSEADRAKFNEIFDEIDVIKLFLTSGLGPEDVDIFGLKKGMSISEIRALGFGDLEEQGEGVYAQFNPKVPIGALNATFVVPPSSGLVKVLFGFEVKADEYGFKIREKYEELRDLLEWKYGKGVEQDFLRPDADSMLKDPPFYMTALAKGARVLNWSKGFILDNRWQLQAVGVKAEGIDFNTGMVIVIYEFDGFGKYIDKQKSGF